MNWPVIIVYFSILWPIHLLKVYYRLLLRYAKILRDFLVIIIQYVTVISIKNEKELDIYSVHIGIISRIIHFKTL